MGSRVQSNRKYNRSLRRLWAACGLTMAILGTAGCATNRSSPDESRPDQPAADQTRPLPDREPPAARARTPRPAPRLAVEVEENEPLRYVVKRGDTLWDIADYFLADPWYWPELWYANPDIANPHLIYPGDILELVWVDGRPQLRRAEPRRGERLSPEIREQPIDAAIPTIPLDAIRQFLNGPRLVTEEELDEAPYVIHFLDEHLIGGTGDELYVRKADPTDGDDYALIRPGQRYIDPDNGELLGYEAIPVGRVTMSAFADVSTGEIQRSYRESLIGDRLLPVTNETLLASDFYPHAPEKPVDGGLIAVFDGVSEIGQYQIVVLNRGEVDGIERGHVLDILQTGRQTRDPLTGERLTLPDLKAGTLMVFEVEQELSFALIMRATRAVHVHDSVRNPADS